VAARHWSRYLVKWICVFAATEEQASVVSRLTIRLVTERSPKWHAD
jgi:hypothetical protein